MGRKTKLTPDVQEKVCNALRAAMPQKTAAALGGISVDSFYGWLKKGEEAQSGIYFDFFQAVKKAEEEAKARLVGLIQKTAVDTWTAAAWLLERRWPEEFGQRMELRGNKDQPLNINLVWDRGTDD